MKIIVQFFFFVGGGGRAMTECWSSLCRFGIQLQAISKFKGRGGGAKSKETIIQVPKTVNPNMVQNIRVKSQTNK